MCDAILMHHEKNRKPGCFSGLFGRKALGAVESRSPLLYVTLRSHVYDDFRWRIQEKARAARKQLCICQPKQDRGIYRFISLLLLKEFVCNVEPEKVVSFSQRP